MFLFIHRPRNGENKHGERSSIPPPPAKRRKSNENGENEFVEQLKRGSSPVGNLVMSLPNHNLRTSPRTSPVPVYIGSKQSETGGSNESKRFVLTGNGGEKKTNAGEEEETKDDKMGEDEEEGATRFNALLQAGELASATMNPDQKELEETLRITKRASLQKDATISQLRAELRHIKASVSPPSSPLPLGFHFPFATVGRTPYFFFEGASILLVPPIGCSKH